MGTLRSSHFCVRWPYRMIPWSGEILCQAALCHPGVIKCPGVLRPVTRWTRKAVLSVVFHMTICEGGQVREYADEADKIWWTAWRARSRGWAASFFCSLRRRIGGLARSATWTPDADPALLAWIYPTVRRGLTMSNAPADNGMQPLNIQCAEATSFRRGRG
jgi:hypothetical protein